MAPVTAPALRGRATIAIGAIAAALGFLLCALGLALDPVRTWFSYLTALAFAVSIAVGALVLQMVGYAANARWMSVTRRLTESVTLAFPALALLFIPLLFGADQIYPWLRPPHELTHHELELIHHRAPYMSLTGFAVRGFLFFAIWIVPAELLRRWSLRRDREIPDAHADGEAALRGERMLSSALLPAVAIAITFAAFDWIMSLQAAWYSTIFGIYVLTGGFVAAIALVIALARAARNAHGLHDTITPNHFHALGRLLLAFTAFWAYCAFFQAMLIRIADRPEEVTFYLQRIAGPWELFVYVLIVGRFALPFVVLLPRAIKFRPRPLVLIAWWALVMHLVDVYWLVIPVHAQGAHVLHWVDLAGLAAVLGSAVAFAAWRSCGVPIVASRDPFLPEGIAYRSPL
jgi:hypothetical protein